MIPFSKLRKILQQPDETEVANQSPLAIDQTDGREPVVIDTPDPVLVASNQSEHGSTPVASLGDTQQMDNETISEQLSSLRHTIEAGAFESREEKEPVISAAFGNHPPTIEMERPKFPE